MNNNQVCYYLAIEINKQKLMSCPTFIELDWSALAHNFHLVKKQCPQAKIMAVIKSDGYGHGLLAVAGHLPDADGFAVACIEEALQLRAAGISQPILLLSGFFEGAELPLIAQHHLACVLHQPWQCEELLRYPVPTPLAIWLKVDTGMGRLGLSPEQLHTFWPQLKNAPQVQSLTLMSHMACADDRNHPLNQQQLRLFADYQQYYQTPASLANSACLLAMPNSHYTWVRAGIILYGVSPFLPEQRLAALPLKPVMRLRSSLMAVVWHHKGDNIGYGGTWRCPQDMPVGIIPIGYGDGYPRHAKNGTPVLLNQRPVPLIGRVSMNLISLDLRSQPHAQVGDPVLLWGQGLPVETVADHADTIGYQLLTNVTQRVARKTI